MVAEADLKTASDHTPEKSKQDTLQQKVKKLQWFLLTQLRNLPDPKFGHRVLVLSRHLRVATSSTQLPHLRLCQSLVREKEVEKKTKTENQ